MADRAEDPFRTGSLMAFPGLGRVSKLLSALLLKYRLASLLASIAIYIVIVLSTGGFLAVSSNYFVILPLAVISIGYGVWGGLIAGFFALPANLLLFHILGHPEFSPASKLIAECSGIAVGFIFGRLSEYFQNVQAEIERRIQIEEELRKALSDREILFRELNHRVKNNLNVIKSFAQIQRSRSDDANFLALTDELISRIFTIALVHEQLDESGSPDEISLGAYIETLARSLEISQGGGEQSLLRLDLDVEGAVVKASTAFSLGLIINEILSNVFRHYRGVSERRLPSPFLLSLNRQAAVYHLVFVAESWPPLDEGDQLSLKMVNALAGSLGAKSEIVPVRGDDGSLLGTRYELSFIDSPL